MQLLRQIWNERRSNGWLWTELLVVLVVLWYIVDWNYTMARVYYEPVGFDITDTYYLELSAKNAKSDSYIPKEQKHTTAGQDIIELVSRLQRLPEVEAVSVSTSSRPYIGNNFSLHVRLDTLSNYMLKRSVTPDFFQVFRYQSVDGRGYQPLVQALKNQYVVVCENFYPKDYKGEKTLLGKELVDVDDSTQIYKVGAVSSKVRYNDYWSNFNDQYVGLLMNESDLAGRDFDLYPTELEVCLRVKPGTSADFAERLMKLSDKQLKVGNLFILQVHDYEDIRTDFQQSSVSKVQLFGWMMGFLLLNILLGIIGTFWFRTQHRRAELGLRIAVGSSRRRIWNRLNAEGLLLLALAAVPAAVLCYNLGSLDFAGGYIEWGILRFLMTFGATCLIMALLILLGIWFPARQAIRIQPAEALHEE